MYDVMKEVERLGAFGVPEGKGQARMPTQYPGTNCTFKPRIMLHRPVVGI
jgi:hypothetical protein